MYHLFAFNDHENDWNTGGMNNYKGSFDSLEELKSFFHPAELLYPIASFGQIAVNKPSDLEYPVALTLLATYEASNGSHPKFNCWISVLPESD